MASLNEYKDSAVLMGEVIADAAKKRGEIAVNSQEADRRAKRRKAAEKWAESDADEVAIEALDLQGEPNVDGPIVTEEGRRDLDVLLKEARFKARYHIGPQLRDAEKLAVSAPQELASIVLSMQMRQSADFFEVADLYARCASVSWPLAKSVADAAAKFGLFIWDEQGILDAEAPRALMRKVDEMLAIVAGKASERPTSPGYGARSAKHGQGTYAVLEMLETLDKVSIDYDGVCDALIADPALVAVYDMATGKITDARSVVEGKLDARALKRMSREHKDALEGNMRDYAAYDAAIEKAFSVK